MSFTEKTMLIIDDSMTNILLLQAVLDTRGYHTLTALSAKDAFLVMEKNKPDLLLLDLLMPEISGYDFLAIVKSNKETKDIPVIIVSAVTDSASIARTMELGAHDYIKKPVELELLVQKVKEALK